MKLHTTEWDLDVKGQTKLWNELRTEVSLVQVEEGEEPVGGQSGFAHIAGGYSSGYYGYLSSQVSDFFLSFQWELSRKISSECWRMFRFCISSCDVCRSTRQICLQRNSPKIRWTLKQECLTEKRFSNLVDLGEQLFLSTSLPPTLLL